MSILDPKPLTPVSAAAQAADPATTFGAALSATYGPTAEGMTEAFASKAAETAIESAVGLGTRGVPVKTRPVSKVVGFFGKAGHGWVSNTPSKFNMNDTTVPMLGTQSISTIMGPSETARFDSPALAPFTVNGKYVRFTYRFSGDITNITLYFASDSSNTNRISKNVHFDPANTPQNVDKTLDIPITDLTAVSGTPDKDNIVLCRISITTGAGGGSVSIGGVYLTNDAAANLPNGAVVISADDSSGDHWSIMRPKLAEYGFAATIYPAFDRLEDGTGSFLTVAQAQYMQNVHGFEFGSHALDMTEYHTAHVGKTEEWLRTHFEGIIAKNKQYGFRGDSFAWPSGASDVLSRRIAADYFRSARSTRQDANETHPPRDPMHTRAVNVGAFSLSVLQGYVDRAKAGRAVCRFLIHALPVTDSTENDTARQVFYDLIDYIYASGVPVYTESQIMDMAVS